MSSVAHVHTYQPQFQGPMDFYFSSAWYFNAGRAVAQMINFPDTCSWAGMHVHESHLTNAAGSGINNCGTYCAGSGGPYLNTDWVNWTREFYWG